MLISLICKAVYLDIPMDTNYTPSRRHLSLFIRRGIHTVFTLKGNGTVAHVASRFSLSLSLLVLYVTCNDISVIYVTAQMCRRTEEEVVPTVGLPIDIS